ncbi:DUF5908 family protein [Pinibacter soli]|uniref:DUF5908 family protein n=1 Tax=Pinibacter soli TaxID=3044211 RepID=A0ABT6RD36_9BACT|nr:DUF5908 family protein [Pinibacter soli]MDI3319784.1 DUF5908 family protein [Pinibacter soli]
MPVEIRELTVKSVIGANQSGPANPTNMVGEIAPADISKLKKEIVKEVTEEVLKILRQQTER